MDSQQAYLVLEPDEQELNFLPPATKLGQGYIFTGVCDSVNGGGCLLRGRGVCSQGGMPRGVCLVETPGTTPAAGGTHPTGMHSCLAKNCFNLFKMTG